jgi:hypothetical protein
VADYFSSLGKEMEGILNQIKGRQAEIETRYIEEGIDAKASWMDQIA